jgi:hypothetical protein
MNKEYNFAVITGNTKFFHEYCRTTESIINGIEKVLGTKIKVVQIRSIEDVRGKLFIGYYSIYSPMHDIDFFEIVRELEERISFNYY